MADRNQAETTFSHSEGTQPGSRDMAIRNAQGRRTVALLFLAFLASVTGARLSGAQALPAVMHTPQGALDIAGILPGKYGLLAKKTMPIGPGEAAVSSVKAIAGLMKQAADVTALLPEDNAGYAGAALRVAGMVPQMSPKPIILTAAEIKASRAFMWPVDGLIYSTFKATRGRRIHGAIDIVTKKGTPIAAAAGGTVVVAANGGKFFTGYGKIVIIDHGKDVHTVYAHCDSFSVKIGQQVKAGDFIGTVGRTGRATTNLCHFEVRVAGKKTDPLLYLPERPEMVKAHNWKSPPKAKKAN